MKKVFPQLFLSAIALVVVLGSLSIPQTVYNNDDMEATKFGYPIHFITQDVSQYDPPFPWEYGFTSPWESPTDIHWINLIISYLATFFVLELIYVTFKKYILRFFVKK